MSLYMGDSDTYLCLSIPTTLRCAGFLRTETIIILIPPILELFFSFLSLRAIVSNGRGRSYWLLIAETWSFCILAFVDFVIHLVGMKNTLHEFEGFDMTIGVLSSVPIVLYTTFLFQFARSSLLPSINPPVFRRLVAVILIFLIPFLVLVNELASLVGVAYSSSPTGLSIGYKSSAAKTLSETFTTVTLSPLSFYQLLVAFLSFFRAGKGMGAGTIDLPGGGVGWEGIGMALGGVESLIGFGSSSFANVFLRRWVRFLGRSFIIFGLIRSRVNVNSGISADSFSMLPGPGEFKLKRNISAPRTSTFIHHQSGLHRRTPSQMDLEKPYPPTPPIPPSFKQGERVTVLYPSNSSNAPRLEMKRLSNFRVPISPRLGQVIQSLQSNRTTATTTTRSSIVFRERKWDSKVTVPNSPSSEWVDFNEKEEEPQGAIDEAKAVSPNGDVDPSSTSNLNLARLESFPTPPTTGTGSGPQRLDRSGSGSDDSHASSNSSLSRKLSTRKPAPIASPNLIASFSSNVQRSRRNSFPPVSRLSTPDSKTKVVEEESGVEQLAGVLRRKFPVQKPPPIASIKDFPPPSRRSSILIYQNQRESAQGTDMDDEERFMRRYTNASASRESVGMKSVKSFRLTPKTTGGFARRQSSSVGHRSSSGNGHQ